MIDSFIKVISGNFGFLDILMFGVDIFAIYLIIKLIIFLFK